MPDLDLALADLNTAAEQIWLAASGTCPDLSVEVLPQIGSTNSELVARGRRGEHSPTLLAAVHQTAGRGRQGRHWLASPGDSLTFSLGLPLRLDQVPGSGSALSLAMGLAVAEALAPISPSAPIGLKWPNDLWCQGGKLGGILIEVGPAPALAEGLRWVVIGLGLNVGAGEATAAFGASSLRQTRPVNAPPLSPGQVWSLVAPAMLRQARQFEQQGFAPLRAAYSARDVLAGHRVDLWAHPGQGPGDGHPPSAHGLAQGVDDTGALLVHTDTGLQSWRTGEVSVRRQD